MTPDYATLPDSDAEQFIYQQMRVYDDAERLKYSQIGLMALAVDRRLLWKWRTDPADGFPCRSFSRYLKIACPYACSTVYAALRDVESLQDVPADELAQIPQSNIATMKQLSTQVRAQPAILKAAQTQRTEAFVETVRRAHPDQHLSRRSAFRFNPTEEQRAEIEEAVDLAIQRGDATCKEEAIFMWAIGYKQECEQRMMEAHGKAVAHA